MFAWVIRVDFACPRHVRLGGNLGNAGCPVLPVEGSGLDVIQAPKPEPRIIATPNLPRHSGFASSMRPGMTIAKFAGDVYLTGRRFHDQPWRNEEHHGINLSR